MSQHLWATISRPDLGQFLTIAETASLLRVSLADVQNAVAQGDFKAVIIEGRPLVDTSELFAGFGVRVVLQHPIAV